MRRLLFLGALLVVCVVAAPEAQAWCVNCVGSTCMASQDAGYVNCLPVGTAGCMMKTHCAAGTPGCPEGPGRCGEVLHPVAAKRCPEPATLAKIWRLDDVVVSTKAEKPLTTPVSAPRLSRRS